MFAPAASKFSSFPPVEVYKTLKNFRLRRANLTQKVAQADSTHSRNPTLQGPRALSPPALLFQPDESSRLCPLSYTQQSPKLHTYLASKTAKPKRVRSVKNGLPAVEIA